MTLSSATTDKQVIDGLCEHIYSATAAGYYGLWNRHEFDVPPSGRRRRWRKSPGEKNRERLKWALGQCCDAYRTVRNKFIRRGRTAGELLPGSRLAIEDALHAAIVPAGISGWLLSLVAGWIIRKAIEAFVAWLLSEESAAWRAAVEGES